MSDTDESEASTSVPEPTPERVAQSEEIKAKANKFFQEGHLKEAVEQYTAAIELNGRNHILYANRAFCHVKLENYGDHLLRLKPGKFHKSFTQPSRVARLGATHRRSAGTDS